MTLHCHVFDDDPHACRLAKELIPAATLLPMRVLTHRFPGEACRALADVEWDMGTVAVANLHMHGVLGEDVVGYIASHHPRVGLWGITGLWPGPLNKNLPEWAQRACRRIFHKDGSLSLFRWLAQDIERFVGADVEPDGPAAA